MTALRAILPRRKRLRRWARTGMSFVRELATRLAHLSQFPHPVLRLSISDEIDDDLVRRPRQNADRTQLRDRDCVASDDDASARSHAIDEPEKLSLSFIDPRWSYP